LLIVDLEESRNSRQSAINNQQFCFTMTSLPPDLQQVLDDINAADRAADVIAAACTDEQFHWRAREGQGWSVGQCLDHLATINVVYGDAMRHGIENARARGWTRRAPAVPGFFGALFVKSLEPPVRRRLRAPANTRPGPSKSRDGILAAYHTAHEHIRSLVTDAAEIDTNRACFVNPFLRVLRVRVSTGLRVIAAHDRRHLWQAEQVRQAPGYPAGTRATR
jgi:hypothetical protein